MLDSFDQAGLDRITAPVEFAVDTGETPITLVSQPGNGPETRTGSFVQRKITIHNGRPITDRLDLDREGFRLMRRPTTVVNLYDDEEIRRVYYPEMEMLIKEVTGASNGIPHRSRTEYVGSRPDIAVPHQSVAANGWSGESAARRAALPIRTPRA